MGVPVRAEMYLVMSKLLRQQLALAAAVQAISHGDVRATAAALERFNTLLDDTERMIDALISGEGIPVLDHEP